MSKIIGIGLSNKLSSSSSLKELNPKIIANPEGTVHSICSLIQKRRNHRW